MKIDRLVRRLEEDSPNLATIGEMVGNELHRDRFDILREARSVLAKHTESMGTELAKGYVMALRDVLASYECTIEPVTTETVDEGPNLLIKIEGKTFYCEECGSNMFHRIGKHHVCNGCSACYIGTREHA